MTLRARGRSRNALRDDHANELAFPRRRLTRYVFGTLVLVTALAAAPSNGELLVVLTDTGAIRDGLPVYTRHSKPQPYLEVLTRGFSGRLLRVYRYVQHRGARAPIEPAYLLVSANRGGFARHGFWLDADRKADGAYIDLHRSSPLAGRFGAMDQIFPHELMHVMLRQLAGPAPRGGGTQVHAAGVTTDRITAFQEGFAEHAQVMAVDDPDADPRTRALAASDREWRIANERLDAFQRALVDWWPPAPRARIGFLSWFGATEQVQRYYAVKRNLFAFEPAMPEALLNRGRLRAAYAWRSIAHGDPANAPRRLEELLATEGAIAALFHRLVTSPFADRRAAPGVYADFGADAAALSSTERAYLKIFHAVARDAAHDTDAVLRALQTEFPGDADDIRRIAASAGIDVTRRPGPEIWLANPAFVTGTSMFDQHAALPRTHAFDLNAASIVDLLAVPGMDRASAVALLAALPVRDLADLAPDARARLRAMSAGAQTDASKAESSVALSLPKILWSYAWRALAWIGVSAAAGAWLIARVRPLARVRRLLIASAAAAATLFAAWIVEPAGVAPFVAVVVFGVPSAVWAAARRGRQEGLRALASWLLAALPAILISTPL